MPTTMPTVVEQEPATSIEVDIGAQTLSRLLAEVAALREEVAAEKVRAKAEIDELRQRVWDLEWLVEVLPKVEWLEETLVLLDENSRLRQADESLRSRAVTAEGIASTLRGEFQQFREQAKVEWEAAFNSLAAKIQQQVRQLKEDLEQPISQRWERLKTVLLGRGIILE